MRTNLGSVCASGGGCTSKYFLEIWLKEVSLVKAPRCETLFSYQVLPAPRVTALISWLHAGCFGSLLANGWVLLKDPKGGPWES